MGSVIHRGERFTFDESIGSCGETEGHNAKCPTCVPERYLAPDRLLAWITDASDRDHAAHVYSVASSWMDPLEASMTTARRVGILADLASGDSERIAPHLSGEWGQMIVSRSEHLSAIVARPYLNAEATRAVLDG